MDEERTLDLTNLYGFARLYKTLVQDGGGEAEYQRYAVRMLSRQYQPLQ